MASFQMISVKSELVFGVARGRGHVLGLRFMKPHKISYTDPVERCLKAVGRILFKPFDIGKWFALGFSAWLATLLSGAAGFQGNYNFGGVSFGDESSEQFVGTIQSCLEFLRENLALVITIATIGLVLLMTISLLLTWVSARGKFMYLDNLVHNRSLVKKPWAKFKRLGNSLFLWQIVFGVIVSIVLLAHVGGAGYFAVVTSQNSAWSLASFLIMLAAALFFLMLLLVTSYIQVMLEDFVVPIMYRDGLKACAAWSSFLALHKAHIWKFALYFLWSALLRLAASMGLAMVGLATCCIGFILMAIPYIGAVLILPVSSFLRLFGPEFLRQFGDEYDIFPPPAPPTPPASGASKPSA